MRRIHKVFGNVKVICADMQLVPVVDVPPLLPQFRHIESKRGVSLVGVAHPDEHNAVAFQHRIAVNIGGFGQVRLPRHPHTGTVRAKGHTVIAALNGVADTLALGQRQQPVRAAIFEHGDLAIAGAVGY